ncbi:igLON family member 5-like isoform X1 [Spodoptera frugiperda]|uniref:IgLON family member 5-like isoform X1 n=1 Tax=Spodoptera frugiperda TaxID=7108 RepID=A0A9R0F1A7_SPOFR|nr:igLON family member 5-like isoform X1 [Spodoptera frugiperda]XP_050556693.1 igLON family member 5-like isoform X1 [Spodoptera frugiperda]XP_050556694.1 igLON family member 5-like isoform X1 [Spodoptera frugiperda]XP_050556696.1 igLON family member 5-like isoform X1 [Spodoptera frugiperda]
MEMYWVLLAAVFIAAQAQNNRNDGPRFLSRGHSFRTVVGDTLLLPCQVQNLGSLVLLWRRGPAVLTAASLMVTRDERFRLVDGYNLQITDVGPQDAGDYVCQISDRVARDQVHTVEVLVPPSVRASPESRHAAARRGGAAVLECRAAGNPVPTVTWHKLVIPVFQNDTNTRLGEGPQLQLSRLERGHSGRYACTVDNGVGAPLVAEFQLQVLYPPEITVERSWVHTGEGFRAELLCTVLADPPAEVTWYQNSFPLSASERVTMSARGNNHTLLIANVQPEDFGNYSCVADNSLGRARQHVEVSGRPGPARFTSAPLARAHTRYLLAFAVDSYPPLDELRLLYRQLAINESFQQPGRWHDVVIPAPEPAGSLTHRVTHELRGLQPGAVYEAIVQAKNRYGWNEVSDIFQFHTLGGTHTAHADELTPMFAATSRPRLASSVLLALIYTLRLI